MVGRVSSGNSAEGPTKVSQLSCPTCTAPQVNPIQVASASKSGSYRTWSGRACLRTGRPHGASSLHTLSPSWNPHSKALSGEAHGA